MSTLELDNTLQRLYFAGLVATNSARVSCGVATNIRNWLQFGYKFEMPEKEESRKSLIYRTLSWALQDGLGFKKMKSVEILRNYKKLNYSKL